MNALFTKRGIAQHSRAGRLAARAPRVPFELDRQQTSVSVITFNGPPFALACRRSFRLRCDHWHPRANDPVSRSNQSFIAGRERLNWQ